jgi:hypothetical protein
MKSSQIDASAYRQELCKEFALRLLSPEELKVFQENFSYFWDRLSERLYDVTCRVLGFDLDEYLFGKVEKVL